MMYDVGVLFIQEIIQEIMTPPKNIIRRLYPGTKRLYLVFSKVCPWLYLEIKMV